MRIIQNGQPFYPDRPHLSLNGAAIVDDAQNQVTTFNVNQLTYKATATSYIAIAADHVIGVTNTAAARTVTIPAAAPVGSILIVKDESGGAAAHNITVLPAGGLLDGAASLTISSNYGSLTVYSNGVNWFSIA